MNLTRYERRGGNPDKDFGHPPRKQPLHESPSCNTPGTTRNSSGLFGGELTAFSSPFWPLARPGCKACYPEMCRENLLYSIHGMNHSQPNLSPVSRSFWATLLIDVPKCPIIGRDSLLLNHGLCPYVTRTKAARHGQSVKPRQPGFQSLPGCLDISNPMPVLADRLSGADHGTESTEARGSTFENPAMGFESFPHASGSSGQQPAGMSTPALSIGRVSFFES